MQNIEINHQLLERVAKINLFALPQNIDYVLFGVRGGLPMQADNYDFVTSQTLRKANVGAGNLVDYKTFCCTIGIWNRKDKTVAVFPASTVPHADNLAMAAKTGNFDECNQLFTGYYPYFKGIHGGNRFHVEGLRHYEDDGKGLKIVCRRLGFRHITIFENGGDTVSTTLGDNFHPAYTYYNGGNGQIKASHGCQIIAGYPDPTTVSPNNKGIIPHMRWVENKNWEKAAWNNFQKKIYSFQQENFSYMLLNWEDYVKGTSQQLVLATPRHGSSGSKVSEIKKLLKVDRDADHIRKDTFEKFWEWQKYTLKLSNPSDYLTEDLAKKLGNINLPNF